MPLPPSVLADPVWAHLAENWKPIPKRPGYVLGLLLLSVALVVVPLVYVGLIGSVLVLGLIAGRVWLLVGAVVALFLLRPLFSRRPRGGRPVELKEFEALELHSFVQNVCTIIGAPAPRRISVDCDVNASASFGGVFGVLLRRAELTLGLPLVGGMTKRQLAGVLAHEFGHFSQGTGMLVRSLAIAMVNLLNRAVHERDGWDELLETVGSQFEDMDWYWRRYWVFIWVVAWVTRGCIWIARQLLRLPCFIANALVGFMAQQMEYDADRYEVQLAGSAAFEPTFHKLGELGWVYGRALEECRVAFSRKRPLPSDFPAYVVAMARRITPEDRDALRTTREKEQGGLFSTHPPSRVRIERARAQDQPGLYFDDGPASELLGDFEGACAKTTRAMFRAILGPYFVGTKFEDTGAVSAASAQDEQRQAALPRYLGFDPPTWRPLFPTMVRVPDVEDPKPVAMRLRAARQKLKELARAAREQSPAYRKASEEAMRWEQARAVMDAGVRFDFKAAHMTPTSRDGVSHAIEKCTREAADAAWVIDEAGEVAMARLTAALCMLGVAGIERVIPGAGALRGRADALLAAASAMRQVAAPAVEARRATCAAIHAAGTIKDQRSLDKAKGAIRPLSDEIRNRLDDVRRALGGAPDPFAPASEGAGYGVQQQQHFSANLGESVVGASPAWRELGDILSAGELFMARYAEYTRRILGELVEIGEKVERAIAAQGESAKAERSVESRAV